MALQVDGVSGVNLTADELLPVGSKVSGDDLLPVIPRAAADVLLPVPNRQNSRDTFKLVPPSDSQTCSSRGLKPFSYYTQGRVLKLQPEGDASSCAPKSRCDYEQQASSLAADFQKHLAELDLIEGSSAISGPEEMLTAREHYQQARAIYQKFSELLAEYKKQPDVSSSDVASLEVVLHCDDYQALQLKMESICRAMRQPLMEGLQINAENFNKSSLTNPLTYLHRIDAYAEGLRFIADHLGYDTQEKKALEKLLNEQKTMAFKSLHQNLVNIKKEAFKVARAIGKSQSSAVKDAVKDFDEVCQYLQAFAELALAIPGAKNDIESGYFADKVMWDVSGRAFPEVLEKLKGYHNKTSLTPEEFDERSAYIKRAEIIKSYVDTRKKSQLENHLNLLKSPYEGTKLMAAR